MVALTICNERIKKVKALRFYIRRDTLDENRDINLIDQLV